MAYLYENLIFIFKKPFILTFLITFVIIFYLFNYNIYPGKENYLTTIPDRFLINSSFSNLKQQEPNMCAGYSASFVLQHYGIDIPGIESYREMAYHIPFNIGIPPYRLVHHLNNSGLITSIYRGNLLNLKTHIASEHPVIVLIGNGFHWQHYIVLLGYNMNKQTLYFYDPQRAVNPLNNRFYINRRISFADFYKLWSNGLPIYNHVYIPVKKNTDLSQDFS